MNKELIESCKKEMIKAIEKSVKETFVKLGVPISEKDVNGLASRIMQGRIELILFGEVTIKTSVEIVGDNE